MVEGLERDTDIVTAASRAENVIDDETDVPFETVATVRTAEGLADEVDSDKLVIVDDPGAEIDLTVTDGQVLPKNITVQGGGSTIRVRGARTGTVTDFTAPGSRPTLVSTSVDSNLTGVFTVGGSNTHIVGLGIAGTGGDVGNNHGIRGLDNLSNIVIADTMITEIGDEGIFFGNENTNIRIADATINNSGNSAIEIGDNNTNIAIMNTVIDTTGGESISFSGDNSGIRIDGVTVRNSLNDGIDFDSRDSNIAITNVTLENIDEAGLQFDRSHENIVIDNATVRIAGTGFEFLSSSSNVTILNSTVTGSRIGIELELDNSNFGITGNTFVDINGSALKLEGANVVGIDNNTFAGSIGILLDVDSIGNTINGAGNVDNTVLLGEVCQGAGNFTGSLEIGGVVIVDGGPPCT